MNMETTISPRDAASSFDAAPLAPQPTDADPYGMLADVPVRLSVELGSTSLTIARITRLREGEVVELDRQADEPLDIKVNGTLVAKAEVVTVDGRFGVRIVELVERGATYPAVERR